MLCKKCKKEIPDNSQFCNHCGSIQVAPLKPTRSRGNGQGSVFKHKGKWKIEIVVGYTQDNKKKTISKSGFLTKKEAQDYIANFKGKNIGSTISDLWALFYNGELKKLSEKRQATYELAYKRIFLIHNIAISEISFPTLQNIINSYSYYNARYIKDLLSKIYQLAIPQGFVTSNLSNYLSLPQKTTEKKTLAFSKDDIDKIWSAYNNNDEFAKYLLIMIYTGMMTSELLSITPSMIDLENNLILGANSSKTNARKNMPIVFPDILKPLLENIKNTYPANVKIFNKTGTTFNRQFKVFQCKHNLTSGTSPYSARRTTATILALNNVSPALIAKIMRQTNYQTTLQYYTKINVADEIKALNTL